MASVNRDERMRRHWEKTRNLTYVVLVIWAIFGVVTPWFAKELDSIVIFGWELGYYFVVQGSLIVFVLLIVYQNWRQDAIDDEFGADQ
jgi:putative solute:sodium symporter small subunit